MAPLLSFLHPSRRHRLELLRPRLHRLARAWCHDTSLADDLAQDALLKALGRLDQLRDEVALESWLFSILNNCWRDHLRRQRDDLPAEDLDELVVDEGAGPEQHAASRQAASRVRAGVARLPLGQRQALTLVDLEEMSYAQAAAVLAIPVGTLMSRLARARQALAVHLRQEERIDSAPNVRRFK